MQISELVLGEGSEYSKRDIKMKQVFSGLSLYLLLVNVNLTMGVRELAGSRPGQVLQWAYTQLSKYLHYNWGGLNLTPEIQIGPSGVSRPVVNSPSDASLQPRLQAEQCGATFQRGGLIGFSSERVGPAVKTVPGAESSGATHSFVGHMATCGDLNLIGSARVGESSNITGNPNAYECL